MIIFRRYGAFGVDPGDRFKIECGAYLKGRAEMPLMENDEHDYNSRFLYSLQ